jgi:hypothetical protein
MPQKKKQNKKEKKTNKKPHRKQVLKKIVQQSIPYFASEQNSGHQYNKDHTQFVQQQQQQTRTDSLVGDLVSKLISKIENSGTQQTQQYSNEVQPITNDNSNTNSGQTSGNTQTITNNIYPNSGQSTTSTDTPDPKKTAIETAAGTALSVATGYSPEVTGGIAAGSAVGVGLIGGIIAGRKKIGQAFKNTFSGKKTGGTATSSRLLKEDNYVRGTKPGVNTDLQTASKTKGSNVEKYSELPNPLQGDFDEYIGDSTKQKMKDIQEQVKKYEQSRKSTKETQITPKPSPRAISTQITPKPSPRATPRPSLEGTPLNILLHPSTRYMEPTTSLSPGSAAGVIRARTSGIQEHSGVLTRNLRQELGEAHTELKSKRPKSKHPEYVSGYDARRYDDQKGKTKQLVPVYNLEHNFNKAYFRKELKNNREYEKKLTTQLSSRSKNPFSGSEGSASEISASEQSYTRPSTRQAQRMRSTMLSQTLTPESNIYVAKSGNKSN